MAAGCTPSGTAFLEEEGELGLVQQEASWDAGAPPCPTDGGSCVPVSPATPLEGACLNERWIILLAGNEASCLEEVQVAGGKWVGSRLFEPTAGEWDLPPGLSSFCAYDWTPNDTGLPSQHEVNALKAAHGQSLAKADPDCQTVGPLGSSATVDAGWPTLHADFHLQTGRLAELPVDAGLPPVEVRVAVVDSAPHVYSDGEAVEDRLGHGHAIGRIIRELGCPEGSPACIAQVSNHLALPQVKPNVRDLEHGGFFGQQTQLARAIHAAVSDWRSHNAGLGPEGEPATLQPRLIINLSLAWDGRYGGPYSGANVQDLPAPVRAVHAAITHAVCRGAVVIAAAGNDPGGPDEVSGPMFPAGWEEKPAPGAAECSPLEGQGYPEQRPYRLFPPTGADVYQPLVYAVGGVRGDDHPLASTRTGGRPRLAAPGAHAVAADVDSSGTIVPTDILTGTSVSTAVVSGIAATVWGYRPELSGPELMGWVRQAAVDLVRPADFCLGGTPCPWASTDVRRSIRRVSLCKALVAACSGGLGHCPDPAQLPVCAPRPAYGARLPRFSVEQWASIESQLDLIVPGSALKVDLPPLSVCRHASLRAMRWRYDKDVCPFRQYYGLPLQPWTTPQPGKNPCTVCVIQLNSADKAAPTANVYISIDSEYSTRSLYSPTVLLNGKHEVDLSGPLAVSGMTELSGGDEVKVMDLPLDPTWLPIQSAALTLKGEEAGVAYSTSSEMLVQ